MPTLRRAPTFHHKRLHDRPGRSSGPRSAGRGCHGDGRRGQESERNIAGAVRLDV